MQQKQRNRPPHKMYIFERGWELTGEVSREIMSWANASAATLSRSMQKIAQGVKYENGFAKSCGYIAIAFLALINLPIYLLAILTITVFVTLHGLALLLLDALALSLIGLLNATVWCYNRIIGIHYRCPQPYCYHEMAIPTFLCKKCQAPDDCLRPNTYGIFFHRCSCHAWLPTLDIFGRKRLMRICPKCQTPMNGEMSAGPGIDIPVIGGPSAGKTTYISTATHAFIQAYTNAPHNYAISFVEDRDREEFTMKMDQLARGQTLGATPDIAPLAWCLKIIKPGAHIPKLLFFYDAAGEAFSSDKHMSVQLYYRYVRGLIFIIDPCAISAYRRTHQDEIEKLRSSLGPSDLDVESVYQHMLRSIEIYRRVRATNAYALPMAVVVTKVDALSLEEEIGALAIQKMAFTHSSPLSQEDAIHQLVRDFLWKYGLSNLVEEMEQRFSPVRCFSCSALGFSPGTPVRTLDPLAWLLTQDGVITTPKQP